MKMRTWAQRKADNNDGMDPDWKPPTPKDNRDQRIIDLESRLAKQAECISVMREALEYYADKNNWALLEHNSNMRSEISADDLQEFRPKKAEYCGGKLARTSLAKAEEMLKG